MAENKNEVVEQSGKTFSVSLTDSLNEVKEALPIDFNITRFVQNAVALLNENTTLADFAKKNGMLQIKQGLMKGAYLGLDAMNKEYYLIPFGSTLSFMIDYRGNVKLAKKYSIRPIKDIYAKTVRKGDFFEELISDGKPSVNFKPVPFSNETVIGAFAVCLYMDGGMIYDTMSFDDLENTRKSSKANNSPAWKNFTNEMYKKTVLHRLCKMIELEFDNPKQGQLFTEDVEIETDVKEIVKNDIEENANSKEFEIPGEDIETVENSNVIE